MSQDTQLAWGCPHKVREYLLVPAGTDRTPLKGTLAGPISILRGGRLLPPSGISGTTGTRWPGWSIQIGSGEVGWSTWTPRAAQIEVHYVADPSTCPRCQAEQIENDARTEGSEPIWVSGPDLVFQQVAKWSVTEAGSAPLYPWYGTRIHDLIGSRSYEYAQTQVEAEIRGAATGFQRLQQAQARYQGLESGERFLGIRSLSLSGETQTIQADIELLTSSGGVRRSIQYAGGRARLRAGKLPAGPS